MFIEQQETDVVSHSVETIYTRFQIAIEIQKFRDRIES